MAGRLRRSDPAGPGIRRQRWGRGFRYRTGDEPVDQEALARIRALVIPPAWEDVWICPHPNGHIQAVGTDAAGRKQYLYHERWRARRDEEKHRRVVDLAALLPEFRERVEQDLATAGLTERRVLAGALRLLDRGVFRTGGEEYAEENGTRGVATLLRGDVEIHGGALRFCYPAKGGIERNVQVRDDLLVSLVRSLQRGRADDERLLVYRDGGSLREVRAEDVNRRLQEIMGDRFTAKDLRTWHATVLAAVLMAGAPAPTSKAACARAEAAVMRDVAEQLGNTPAVARQSYVDPRVLAAYERGVTIAGTLSALEGADLWAARETVERAVITLLSDEGRE
jgi:DNA topoisomerase IB